MVCSLAAACSEMPRGHAVMECCFLNLVNDVQMSNLLGLFLLVSIRASITPIRMHCAWCPFFSILCVSFLLLTNPPTTHTHINCNLLQAVHVHVMSLTEHGSPGVFDKISMNVCGPTDHRHADFCLILTNVPSPGQTMPNPVRSFM